MRGSISAIFIALLLLYGAGDVFIRLNGEAHGDRRDLLCTEMREREGDN